MTAIKFSSYTLVFSLILELYRDICNIRGHRIKSSIGECSKRFPERWWSTQHTDVSGRHCRCKCDGTVPFGRLTPILHSNPTHRKHRASVWASIKEYARNDGDMWKCLSCILHATHLLMNCIYCLYCLPLPPYEAKWNFEFSRRPPQPMIYSLSMMWQIEQLLSLSRSVQCSLCWPGNPPRNYIYILHLQCGTVCLLVWWKLYQKSPLHYFHSGWMTIRNRL